MKHWYHLLKYFNNKSMMKHAITIFADEQLESIREKALFLIGEQDILSNYPKAIQKLKQIRLKSIGRLSITCWDSAIHGG